MAKAHGPEEFFEVFRTVSQKGKRTQPKAEEEPAPGKDDEGGAKKKGKKKGDKSKEGYTQGVSFFD